MAALAAKKSKREIADLIERPDTSVHSRIGVLAKAGKIPPQPASIPADVAHAWTPAEDTVLTGLHALGRHPVTIANLLYRTVRDVERRLQQLGQCSPQEEKSNPEEKHKPEQPQAPGPKIRPCISCRNPFNSLGPHNRMCDRCRVKAANNRTPFDF